MIAESIVVQLDGVNQLSQASALVGKTATVHQVAAGTGTVGTKLLLLPQGGAGAAGTGGVIVKLESARQMAEASAIIGKVVTVGSVPVAGGTASLLLQPVGVAMMDVAFAGGGAAGAAVKVGAAGTTAAAAKVGGTAAAAAGKSLVAKTGGSVAAKSAFGSGVALSQGAAGVGAGAALTLTGMAVPFLAGGAVAAIGYVAYRMIMKKKTPNTDSEDTLDDDDIVESAAV
ncbi:MAG: hypothetical protein H7840_06700 [Alphaproteobacteria bacterium]